MPAEQSTSRVRLEGALRAADSMFTRLTSAAGRAFPAEMNPLAQTGAVANTSFIIALVSGVLLLLWYSASVNTAYSSVLSMAESPYLSGLVRSVHRYSSDACVLFALLHALKVLATRRFGGPRWLAWVSGLALLFFIWLDGWLGYWLVWDVHGGETARASARFIDLLPIVDEPLSRSFLVDARVNSLTFFVVFFVHVLIPLAVAILLAIHLARVSRSRLLTSKRMTAAIAGALVLGSVLVPAGLDPPARMQSIATAHSVDWFFTLPLVLGERFGAGALAALFLCISVPLLAAPWLFFARRAAPSRVDPQRCFGCSRCYEDCPFSAITLLPRPGRDVPLSVIDANKCVACGICVGACDSRAITTPALPIGDAMQRIEAWLGDGGPRAIALACERSAGGALAVDPKTGLCPQLPGFRVLRVPCAGWVHHSMLEQAAKNGARALAVVSCGDADPYCRLGVRWTAERLAGTREPEFRPIRLGAVPLVHVAAERFETRRLRDVLLPLAEGGNPAPPKPRRRRALRVAGAGALTAALLAATIIPGNGTHRVPVVPDAELVVSFVLPGQVLDAGEKSDAASETNPADEPEPAEPEDSVFPPPPPTTSNRSRARAPVRMRVIMDGRELSRSSYPAGGLFSDMNSVGIERFNVTPGRHLVEVLIGATPDPDEWKHTARKSLVFPRGLRQVLLFDRKTGFRWH